MILVPKTSALSIRPQAHMIVSSYFFLSPFFFDDSLHTLRRIWKSPQLAVSKTPCFVLYDLHPRFSYFYLCGQILIPKHQFLRNLHTDELTSRTICISSLFVEALNFSFELSLYNIDDFFCNGS